MPKEGKPKSYKKITRIVEADMQRQREQNFKPQGTIYFNSKGKMGKRK